ncbi:MAG TPA: class I SAM-dependent methyltransferase [Steroidobacteraceae bacterium]|nr:class I SAM-dependent methyltransferase [Steroidobacteraceae bacterium]
MDASARVLREREFHNQRFADETEREGRVRRFYDAIAYGFDLFRTRVMEQARGRRVLEYGCGTEILAFALSEQAKEVIGIDISDVAIARAEQTARAQQLQNVAFKLDNAEAMSLPDASVDVVAGSGIVHHLDIAKSMRELRRVLRPGGVAIFAEPMGHNPLVNWYRRRTPDLRTPDEHPLLLRDLAAMEQNFKGSHVTYFGLIAPVLGLFSAHPNPRSRITRAVWALDRFLCRCAPIRHYAWFCVIELRA